MLDQLVFSRWKVNQFETAMPVETRFPPLARLADRMSKVRLAERIALFQNVKTPVLWGAG